MRWTVDRLRLGIVILAVVLLLSIAGSILYGHWRLRHLAQDLPGQLGIQIQQTTKGFVLSKTEGGRTVFRLHAARAIAFKTGGLVSLRDVEIDMYNPQGQADTIAGKDFSYDRVNQVVSAQGEAHIVLHIPPSDTGTEAGKREAEVIHVITHGLVFSQKTGVATCRGEVDFQFSDSSGHALGAEYDSGNGHLLLQSQVMLTTVMRKRPTVLHATQATYDRDEGLVHLLEPRYSARTPRGNEQGSAGKATVLLRPEGSVERVDAQNAVKIVAADGNSVRSAVMHVQLSQTSQMEKAHFLGGVQFTQKQPTQQTDGGGHEADVDFDAEGHPSSVTIDGNVQFQQQVVVEKKSLHRTLAANHLVLHMRQEPDGQAQLEGAEATGSAVFTSQNTAPGQPTQKTSIAAQTLRAKFLAGNAIQHLDGTGQTQMRMVAANGDVNTSTGDTLRIDFAAGASAQPEKRFTKQAESRRGHAASFHTIEATQKQGSHDALSAQLVRTAVQTGHVVLQQTSAKETSANEEGGPRIFTATASRAEYEGARDMLTLTGKPEFHDATLKMAAERFEVQYTSGKVLASGAVKTTLRSGSTTLNTGNRTEVLPGGLLSGDLPVHVVAQQALLLHDAQKALFTGQARLWQGSNMVEAPVIEVSRKMQTLSAFGKGTCKECVHSTFVERPAGPAPAGKQTASESSQTGVDGLSTLRVLSGRLLYSDAERKASFFDDVEAIGSAGDLFADHVEVFLTPSVRHLSAAPVSNGEGTGRGIPSQHNQTSRSFVEKIVAIGNVRLIQPGRRGTGSKLVYTAHNGHFLLTGDRQNPPEVADSNHGTVTGQELTFASQTQAIIVSGTSNDSTTTKTRVQKK